MRSTAWPKRRTLATVFGAKPIGAWKRWMSGLAAQGKVATEGADRARAVARLQARKRPGNVSRHGASAAQPLEQEAVHEVEAQPPIHGKK